MTGHESGAVNPYRYYPPRRHTDRIVTDDELLTRWKAGLDTYAIALQVGIPESEVANRLPHIREQRRKDAEWNIECSQARRIRRFDNPSHLQPHSRPAPVSGCSR